MSVILGILCGIVLNFLHLLFTLYLHFKYVKFALFKLRYVLRYAFNDRYQRFKTENDLISTSIKSYSKIPKHIVYVLGDEGVSYEDLVQLILWCLPAGIPVIGFYDYKDEINPEELRQTFQKLYADWSSRIKWGVSFSEEATQDTASCIQVNVLTSKHGRRLLVDSVKELSLEDNNSKLETRSAVESALDDIMMAKLSYCGNPDLLIISGTAYTTYGLSPWHIGFTEFVMVPSYTLLTVDSFVHILGGYANCIRKFGT